MRVLGIEGTAWMASAAVYDTETDEFYEVANRYEPDSGGIHPREAAEHMGTAVPEVVAEALAYAHELTDAEDAPAASDGDATAASDGDATAASDGDATAASDGDATAASDGDATAASDGDATAASDGDATAASDGDATAASDGDATAARDGDDPPIDAVAFSRGPGLGPCLRIVGTAARALAGRLDVPLVGVNHMVAHLEIGRHRSGFDSPVCLNASGANAHLLGYHGGRYRVLGETMDTGVGNALDKFTRHVGWSHPGGPKVEAHAKDGEYLELPYVVKGMDFSFSGIMSAAKDAADDGEAVEDICFGLQEHVFGMLTEVAERALSLTGADELVLGGGVGQNARLREMLEEMCAERGAEFYAPEPRFLRDNANMIALVGAKMAAAGDTISIPDSAVDPNFRPDQVDVTWRDETESVSHLSEGLATGANEAGGEDEADSEATGVETRRDAETIPEADARGAEATLTVEDGTVVKRRLPKRYRHPRLDERLRRDRTVLEARLLAAARKQGVPTPLVRDVDLAEATLRLSFVGDCDLAAVLAEDDGRAADAAADAAATAASADPTDLVAAVGEHLARIHAAGIVHGDPTTRNVRVDRGRAEHGETANGDDSERASGDDSETANGDDSERASGDDSETANGDDSEATSGDDSETTSDGVSDERARSEAPRTYLIDFGLGYYTDHVEDLAMDLHVFEQSLYGTADDAQRLVAAFEERYAEVAEAVETEREVTGDEDVLERLRGIEGRGRYQ
jgi:N6-L-threonylcarbamoyladenine synthase/protein kinase Bud32